MDKMKILLIVEASHAGVGKHVLDLTEGLLRSGHVVHLVYSPVRSDIHFEKRLGEILDGKFSQYQLRMRRSPYPGDLLATWKIRLYLRQNGPFDIIHGHSSKGGALAKLVGIGSRAKVLYTPNAFITANPGIKGIAKVIYGLVEWSLSLITDKIIAVSEDEKRHAASIGISEELIHVIENGIDLGTCNRLPDRRKDFGFPPESMIIGFVGRLTDQKDPGNLLRAFGMVSREVPQARLAIVGEGPLRLTLETLASHLGVEDKIHFLGLQNGADAMTSFDIFVLSSKYEGMPYVLLEAVATGLPIVTTAVAGASNVVANGRNGYIVPIGNPELLANAIGELLSDEKLRKDYSAEAKLIAPRFSVENMISRTEELYVNLVSATSS